MRTVSFSGFLSSTSLVTCDALQGNVLDPVLFLLCTAEILTIAHRHGTGAHSYADDTQLYLSRSCCLCVASASAVVSCIGDWHKWMCSNRLKVNTDKTDFILLGTCQQIEKANFHFVQLGGIDAQLSTTVTCLEFSSTES